MVGALSFVEDYTASVTENIFITTLGCPEKCIYYQALS